MKDFARYPGKSYRAGETILNAGETPQSLFYLKKGHVKRTTDSLDGKELIIHIFEHGSIFPLSWALNGQIPDFSLTALSSCEVAFIPKEDFINLIKSSNPELLKITKRLMFGLEGMAKRVEILSFEKANERVIQTLSYLHKRFGPKFRFTHEELAALTGLTRERVSIEMKKLKDSGKIAYKRGLVTLVTDGLFSKGQNKANDG